MTPPLLVADDPAPVIREEAIRLGFSFCGFAGSRPPAELRARYEQFLREGRTGGMDYLSRRFSERMDPGRVLEGVRSVIAVLLNYFPERTIPEEDNYVVAKYAYGRDYHAVMREKLSALADFLRTNFGPVRVKSFCDSGQVAEKPWAQQCGLGWQGKNTLLINPTAGSFFFIGILLTDLPIPPDEPGTDGCGNCRACQEACPTGALREPYRLDIPRCLSFMTIESRETPDEERRKAARGKIYGCDICQDVCPYNRHAEPNRNRDFTPKEEFLALRKSGWHSMDDLMFARIFADSAIRRTGLARLRRWMDIPREEQDQRGVSPQR